MTTIEQTADLLSQLVAYPSISSDSNIELISFLGERLESAGAKVNVQLASDGKKANLFATIGPDIPGGLVLSGHSDVVPVADQDWSHDPFQMRAHEDKFYGRGTCDMKGFIAAAVAKAADYGALSLKRPVHFAFTYDEETGCIGAQALVEWLKEQGITPAMAIIGEPTMMQVIEGHKGCCQYTTHFKGQAGHGSMPDLGVNAVEYAARYVSLLLSVGDEMKSRPSSDRRFNPPCTTISTGAITGGTAHNVIPETASVDWEFRPVQADDFDFVKAKIEDYVNVVLLPAMRRVNPEADISTEVIGEVVGLEPASENEARDILLELTRGRRAGVVPFGTEAGIFRTLGMSVVVCGPGSIEQAHKPDEFLAREQLSQCLAMMDALEAKLCA